MYNLKGSYVKSTFLKTQDLLVGQTSVFWSDLGMSWWSSTRQQSTERAEHLFYMLLLILIRFRSKTEPEERPSGSSRLHHQHCVFTGQRAPLRYAFIVLLPAAAVSFIYVQLLNGFIMLSFYSSFQMMVERKRRDCWTGKTEVPSQIYLLASQRIRSSWVS